MSEHKELLWLSKLLNASYSKFIYLGAIDQSVWVCEAHPLLPDRMSALCEPLACDCGSGGQFPIDLPTWVNGFCCRLNEYVKTLND